MDHPPTGQIGTLHHGSLYIKCIKLKAEDNVNRNFVFRVGELHTVFASLKAIGKYIDECGIDQSLVEADIYGPTTIQQIKEEKHMKRGIDAYTIVYLALHKLYLAKLFEQYPEEFEHSVKNIESVQLATKSSEIDNHSLKDGHIYLYDTLCNIEFHDKEEEFDNSLTKQAKFLRNFMKMFESLLLFVRATRQKDWELHLTSMNGLVLYFFAHDLQNYARMVPVYPSEMFALKEQDPELSQVQHGMGPLINMQKSVFLPLWDNIMSCTAVKFCTSKVFRP